MSDCSQLSRELVLVLEQGVRLLDGLEPELYARAPVPLGSSGIGAHVRHGLDFCQRLLSGAADGVVDYDARERDPRLEEDAASARTALCATIREVQTLGARDAGQPLRVRLDVGEDEEGWQRSTLGRELKFVISHTIHPYALIAMCLRHFGVQPEADFGVAPSTLRYWKESERCAPLAG